MALMVDISGNGLPFEPEMTPMEDLLQSFPSAERYYLDSNPVEDPEVLRGIDPMDLYYIHDRQQGKLVYMYSRTFMRQQVLFMEPCEKKREMMKLYHLQ